MHDARDTFRAQQRTVHPRFCKQAAAAILTIGALALTACTGAGSTAGGSPGSQELVLAAESTPVLDYAQTGMSGSTRWVWTGIYDTLLRIDTDGTVVPNAAEAFEISDDAMTTTLTLRDDLVFSDGTPIDAEAVKASIEHIRDAAGPDAGRLAGVEIQAVDAETVALHSPTPNGLMPMYMAVQLGVIANPAHFDEAETNPQGSGPYVLNVAETTTGSTYVLDRNEEYWNSEAYPYDTVTVKVLADETARISALRTGQIDAAAVTSTSMNQFDENQFNITTSNVNIEGLMIFDRTGKKVPALGDVRVRQAMNMVFNRDSIVENLYAGLAIPTAVPFNRENELYNADLEERYPYDIEGARELMAEAGYADGFDLTIPTIPGFNTSNPMVVQQLGEIGIRVTEEDLPLTAVLSEILGGKYAVAVFPMESRSALWDLANVVDRTSVWNIFGAGSDELDALITQAQSATGAEADATFQEISDIVQTEAWFASWAAPTTYVVTSKDTLTESVSGSSTPFLYTFRPAE